MSDRTRGHAVAAVVFDLDGVLLDSEPVWEAVRRAFVAEHGGQWRADSQRRIMGMSTAEWAAYLSADLGVQMPTDAVAAGVVQQMAERYERGLPLLPGAVEAVQRLAARWPVGLASSSPEALIEVVLRRSRLAALFTAAVSSDQVTHGKPAPDVYLEAARRLGVQPERCAAVEDSSNGLRAAAAAGMGVIAIPNAHYPPDAAALAVADVVLDNLQELTAEIVERI